MRRSSLIGFFVFLLFVSSNSFAQNRGGFRSTAVSPLAPPRIGALGQPIPQAPGNYSYGRRRNYYQGGYGIASYPVFIGGFGPDYYAGYGDYAGGGVPAPAPVEPPPAAPSTPAVVINQYFGAPPQGGPAPDDPDVQVYSQSNRPTAAPAPAPEPRSYLIALKDHSVFSALAYWVEDRTLHYVTPQNTHNQADLSLVDVDFTKKLNQDRNMTFSVTP